MEHRILTIGDPPYTPESYISQATPPALCDVTWGPGLEKGFMGSVKFAIDQVI